MGLGEVGGVGPTGDFIWEDGSEDFALLDLLFTAHLSISPTMGDDWVVWSLDQISVRW